MKARQAASDAGFVQLLVIGALATLAGLLTVTMLTAAQTSRASAALERLVRNSAVGDASALRMMAAIEDPADDLETRALRGSMTVAMGPVDTTLRIEAEASKIDVLFADVALLERYLVHRGFDASTVTALVQRLSVARESGDGVGALEALRVALTAALPTGEFDRDVTRFGGVGIDPISATGRVLLAIPDLSPAEAKRIAAASPEDRAQYAHSSRYFSSSGRRFSLVTTTARGVGQASERRLPIEISTAGKPIVLAGPY